MFDDLFNNNDTDQNSVEKYDDDRDSRGGGRGNGGGNGGGDGQGGGNGKTPNRQNLLIMLFATVVALVVISYIMNFGSESATKISYNEFVEMIDNDEIEE